MLLQDQLCEYQDSTFLPVTEDDPAGGRLSTLMFYLSSVRAGGLTVFPRLGVWARPSPGSAVLWDNIRRDGSCDLAMLHGGCPVLLGRKVVANKWIGSSANLLRRTCATQPGSEGDTDTTLL